MVQPPSYPSKIAKPVSATQELLLERGSADQDSEELTTLTNSKSMTRSEISNESSNYKDTISKYKDPNHLRSKIEVACE